MFKKSVLPLKDAIEINHGNLKEMVEKIINEALDKKFKSILDDISYRINVLADTVTGEKITSNRLNLNTHIIDGFVFTDNSPTAGSVAWSDVHITYKGTTYTITNGNTNKKYIWWDYDASPNTVLQFSDTKPNLTDDDILIAINDGGIHRLVVSPGKMPHGAAILDGTITSSELGANSVTSAKLAANAVMETHLSDNAVTSTKLASGAVTAGKIANGAINSSSLFTSGVVNNTAIANNAIDSTKLADGAVVANKIGAGAVASSNLNLAVHMIW